MIKALVFDFDGLMVDTETSAYASWQEIYQEYNCELPLEEWKAVLGGSGHEFDPCAYLAQRTGRTLDADALRARRLQRKLELASREPLLPGVAEAIVLGKERGLRLGVASSSGSTWVLGHLDRLGITQSFDAIVTADDVARVKPDPEIYQTAVRRLGVPPHEALAIEDSWNGMRAAKAAGLYCAVVPNTLTQHFDFTNADIRLTSLADMSLDQLLAALV